MTMEFILYEASWRLAFHIMFLLFARDSAREPIGTDRADYKAIVHESWRRAAYSPATLEL